GAGAGAGSVMLTTFTIVPFQGKAASAVTQATTPFSAGLARVAMTCRCAHSGHISHQVHRARAGRTMAE
ncbi:hypothetical protein QPK32_25040, partial [Massilia sp. YIM B02763]|uniref:hypothetical protein n=1 Tax=Massilia sp. YIM B02763 TaxID=3050130 RepID=UPI0025B6DEE3